MRRRDVLASAAGSLIVAGGCLSGSESTGEPTTESTETADSATESATSEAESITTAEPQMRVLPTTPPEKSLDCDGDLSPVTLGDGNSYPERHNGLELEASADTVAIGDEITFTLTNVGDEPQDTGEIYKYNLLRRNDGWEPVFYISEQNPWTDVGIQVNPGGGFRWPFTVEREGLERQNESNPTYYVCSPLEPGEYRFVFFGLVGTNVVGTTFSVTEP